MHDLKDKQITSIGRQIDSSYVKLKWNVSDIFNKMKIIQNELKKRLDVLPDDNLNERKRVSIWLNKINEINEKIEYIFNIKIKDIEKELKYEFQTPELIVISFFQPSGCKLFQELNDYFNNKQIKSILESEFNTFIYLSDAAKVLALIGDAVLDLAIIQILWDPNISKVGDLTIQRSNFVSNENLSKICDKWNLYEHRIHFDQSYPKISKKKIFSVKGTMMESIFGVIYIESGLDCIISSINVLK